MRFFWIDDDPGRKRFADDLGATFVDARSANFAEELNSVLSGRAPHLVVLDHFLRNVKVEDRMYTRGSTIAEAVKEKWPSCPVVGITANTNDSKITRRTRLNYDELFHSYRFLEHRNKIKAIADGFANVSRKEQLDAQTLINLLRGLKKDEPRLVAALPSELKSSTIDEGSISTFYGWVRHLIERPGFLFNPLSSATFLGLNEKGFRKIEEQFEKARYKGIFHNDDEPRWWANRLAEILFEKAAPGPADMSWDVGRKLDGISGDDYSRCYRCRKMTPPPETVAFLDRESDEQRAMHIECTVLHPNFKRELYFEDVRMMVGE
jgi:hypothetical protein